MSLDAAVAAWRAHGRCCVPDVLDAEARVAALARARLAAVSPSAAPPSWLWFESADVDPDLVARVEAVAAAVVGMPVTSGGAWLRRFPRGAWADVDPYTEGFVRFALDLSDPGVVGAARRFPDAAWPSTPGALTLWWEDGETPVGVDLVTAGERVEIAGVLGVAG